MTTTNDIKNQWHELKKKSNKVIASGNTEKVNKLTKILGGIHGITSLMIGLSALKISGSVSFDLKFNYKKYGVVIWNIGAKEILRLLDGNIEQLCIINNCFENTKTSKRLQLIMFELAEILDKSNGLIHKYVKSV